MVNQQITKETSTIRKITLEFKNNLEYLQFIKDLAANGNQSQIAKDLFSQEYEEILDDRNLNEIYRTLTKK